MISSIIFNSVLGDETLGYISTFIENLESKVSELEGKEKVRVYFSSLGGDNYIAAHLNDIFYIHRNKIELIGAGPLYSNGLVIFAEFKGKRRLLYEARGMAHLSTGEISTIELKQSNSEATSFMDYMVIKNNKLIDLFTPLLTKDELTRFTNGENVYLLNNRLKEMFKI